MTRLRCGYGIDIEQAQADGLITTGDAGELRRFGDFLKATAGLPRTSPRWMELYAEYYPEDYAEAIAAQARAKEAQA